MAGNLSSSLDTVPLLLLREKAKVKSPLQACGGRAQKGLNPVGLGGGHQSGWDAWVPVLPLF